MDADVEYSVLDEIDDIKMRRNRHQVGVEKNFICDVCYRAFSTKKYLKRHLHTHLPKGNKYTCDLCNKTYSRKDALKRHLLTHTEQRPHACYMCNESFSRKDELTKHFRTHRNVGNVHICHKCYKSFAREDSLKRHLLIHSGDKLHVCPLCDKRFSRRDELVKHYITHKPPECKTETRLQLSDDEFPMEENLKTLLIIHIKTRKPLRVAKPTPEANS